MINANSPKEGNLPLRLSFSWTFPGSPLLLSWRPSLFLCPLLSLAARVCVCVCIPGKPLLAAPQPFMWLQAEYMQLDFPPQTSPQCHLRRCSGSHPGCRVFLLSYHRPSPPVDVVSTQLPAYALLGLSFARRGCPANRAVLWQSLKT